MAAGNNIAFKIEAKLLQIKTWLLLTAYSNWLSFYPTAPSPIFYDVPFSHNTVYRTTGVTNCVIIFQGHSKSMIFVSSEKAYATCY